MCINLFFSTYIYILNIYITFKHFCNGHNFKHYDRYLKPTLYSILHLKLYDIKYEPDFMLLFKYCKYFLKCICLFSSYKC